MGRGGALSPEAGAPLVLARAASCDGPTLTPTRPGADCSEYAGVLGTVSQEQLVKLPVSLFFPEWL